MAPATESSCTVASGRASGPRAQIGNGAEDEIGGLVDHGGELVAEADPDLVDLYRLAADHDHLARPAADRTDEPEHRLGIHPVRVEAGAVLDPRLDAGLVDLHHIQRPRLPALPACVDQDERVVAAHHLVGEVESAGTEVHDSDPRGQRALAQPPYDLAPEPVVAQPAVTDAGDQDLRRARPGHGLAGASSPAKK